MASEMISTTDAPGWAIGLFERVAEIKVKVDVIPELQRKVEELQRTTVPMREHEDLLRRQETLWNTYQQVMPEWDQRKPQIDQMWEERAELRGGIKAIRVGMAILVVVQIALTIWLALRTSGARITF